MSFILLWAALAGAPDDPPATDHQSPVAVPATTALDTPSEPRPLFEIHKELRRLLRDEAVTKDRQAWQATVVKLVKLYGEITRDERLPTSDSLNKYRVKLRSRLLQVQKDLERELRRERKGRSASARGLAS